MKKLIVLAGLLLVLIPLGSWWFSAEEVVKRRTSHLMAVLSISEGSLRPLRQGKVFSMNGLLAPEVKLDIPGAARASGEFYKDVLESGFSWICENAKSSQFEVKEFRSVEVDGDRARVNVLVEGYMELVALRPVDGLHDVTIEWVRGGDGWRFDRVDWDVP